jgi:hypothetical protein
MKSRRPPKHVELVVYLLAPFDRRRHVYELRKQYRQCLRKHGEKEAKKLAYRCMLSWIWAWVSVLRDIISLTGWGR